MQAAFAWLMDDPVTSTSPTAQIITAVAGLLAGTITAVATAAGLRRRRAAEAELAAPDPENSITRLRERIKSAEERLDAYREHGLPDRVAKTEVRVEEHERRLADLEERMTLHRAADIALEAEAAPRRRRKAGP